MKKRVWMGAVLAMGLCMAVSGCAIEKQKETETAAEAAMALPQSFETETEREKTTEPEPKDISPFPAAEKETAAEPMENGYRIIIMSDIHYLAESLTDRGESFQTSVEHGDGKLTNYVWEIVDAALEEVVNLSPDVVVLSGDMTLQGEKKSHQELAKKLTRLEEQGIQVVVIPGNHDINNKHAAIYSGEQRRRANMTSPEEFLEIYQEFGYSEAESRDSASLSYTYNLGPDMKLLMLDTCQYTPTNKVGGMIKTETYDWIDRQLEQARSDSAILLPIAHHNLLEESKVYTRDCTIEHSEELIERLEEENIPLFLSGHLHVQHFMRNEDGRGIYEIVTSSLTTPPCQYGILEYRDDESFTYRTRQVDMEKWARKHKSRDENLINFNTFSPAELHKIFYNQAKDAMDLSREEETGSIYVDLTESEKEAMAEVYANLNTACYGGKAWEAVEEAILDPGYKMWQEYCYPILLYEYLEYIVEDAVCDYNYLESE